MNQKKRKTASQGLYLKPNEAISDDFLKKLKTINSNYSKNKQFLKYKLAIKKLFQVDLINQTLKSKFFLGGFLEGEASLNVGIKKNKESKFKLYIDPEFSIAQNINGFSNLYLALCVFETGRIRFKTGSRATFVYTIDNRENLKQKVIPFYEKFVVPYGSIVKQKRLKIFKKLLILFENKAHLNLNSMLYEVLPLWDLLRMQKGQANESFKNLQEAQNFIKKAQI